MFEQLLEMTMLQLLILSPHSTFKLILKTNCKSVTKTKCYFTHIYRIVGYIICFTLSSLVLCIAFGKSKIQLLQFFMTFIFQFKRRFLGTVCFFFLKYYMSLKWKRKLHFYFICKNWLKFISIGYAKAVNKAVKLKQNVFFSQGIFSSVIHSIYVRTLLMSYRHESTISHKLDLRAWYTFEIYKREIITHFSFIFRIYHLHLLFKHY